jgi:hypothetical protein
MGLRRRKGRSKIQCTRELWLKAAAAAPMHGRRSHKKTHHFFIEIHQWSPSQLNEESLPRILLPSTSSSSEKQDPIHRCWSLFPFHLFIEEGERIFCFLF